MLIALLQEKWADIQKRKWFDLGVCAPMVLRLLGYQTHFTDSAVSQAKVIFKIKYHHAACEFCHCDRW